MSIHDEEVLGKAYDARLMRRLLTYLRPYKREVVVAVLSLLAHSVLQLAPVQAQGWGHPITSGSRTMHYFFGAAGMEPPGNEEHYSEELIRLPGTGLNYDVPAAVHDGRPGGLPQRDVA